MSAAKRLIEARRRKGARGDPFVWLRADWLAAAACTLPSAELRVVMALQRWWGPNTKASLAYGQIAAMTGLARKAMSAALKALEGRGLIVLARPARRPQGEHGPRGASAVWDLPSRHAGEQPKVVMPPGVARPQSKLTWHCGRLEADLRGLSGPAFKVLCFASAHRHLTKDGAPADPGAFPLVGRKLAVALGLSHGAVADAIKELVATGRLLEAEPSAGRRPSRYALAACYRRHERVLPAGKLPAPPGHGAYRWFPP